MATLSCSALCSFVVLLVVLVATAPLSVRSLSQPCGGSDDSGLYFNSFLSSHGGVQPAAYCDSARHFGVNVSAGQCGEAVLFAGCGGRAGLCSSEAPHSLLPVRVSELGALRLEAWFQWRRSDESASAGSGSARAASASFVQLWFDGEPRPRGRPPLYQLSVWISSDTQAAGVHNTRTGAPTPLPESAQYDESGALPTERGALIGGRLFDVFERGPLLTLRAHRPLSAVRLRLSELTDWATRRSSGAAGSGVGGRSGCVWPVGALWLTGVGAGWRFGGGGQAAGGVTLEGTQFGVGLPGQGPAVSDVLDTQSITQSADTAATAATAATSISHHPHPVGVAAHVPIRMQAVDPTTGSCPNVQIPPSGGRVRYKFDFDWKFHFGDSNDAHLTSTSDSTWRSLDVPHDFIVEQNYDSRGPKDQGFLPGASSWYRKHFTPPRGLSTDLQYALVFDGVYRQSDVYLNGQKLGYVPSGYIGFAHVLPNSLLRAGDNVLAVRVQATNWEGWWYDGGGIYRHVWLDSYSALHFDLWGVYVRSDVRGPISADGLKADASASIQALVVNSGSRSAVFDLFFSLRDDETGAEVASASRTGITIKAGDTLNVTGAGLNTVISQAKLWSPDAPRLYRVLSQLVVDRKLVDTLNDTFGVRKIVFDASRGLLLNDRSLKITGMCNHQDMGGLGAAVPDSVIEFRLRTLKSGGVNAVRGAHNPQTPELLSLADRLGLLVWSEHRSLSSGDDFQNQMAAMVKRDRNHPSIFTWSLCNERSCDGWNAQSLGAQFKATIMKYDTSRPVSAALNPALEPGWKDSGVTLTPLDLYGQNYVQSEYDGYHRSYPSRPVIASETSSGQTDRGVLQRDSNGGYVSCYDEGDVQQSYWREVANRQWIAGAFVWTGFDYRGEPTPYGWPCISSHFGQLDLAGFAKDNWFYYRAWFGRQPIVHLLPHWSLPDSRRGSNVDVWAYSVAPVVELFVNGVSQGRRNMATYGHVSWTVRFTPGSIKAVAYTSSGAVFASDTVETTGAATALALEIEQFSPLSLRADGQHTTLLTCRVTDAQGRTVPTASHQVTFTVQGAGRLLGVANGDPSNHQNDKWSYRNAFNGLLRALVQAGRSVGTITVTATAPGLSASSINITVVSAAAVDWAGGAHNTRTLLQGERVHRVGLLDASHSSSSVVSPLVTAEPFEFAPDPVAARNADKPLDPCAALHCSGRAQCWNGQCLCPPPFEGDNCDHVYRGSRRDTSMCASAPQNYTVSLRCGARRVIRDISFASYGLPSGTCGKYVRHDNCHAFHTESVLRHRCVGRSSCTVLASDRNFAGASCGDEPITSGKRLHVQYVCALGMPVVTDSTRELDDAVHEAPAAFL